MKMIKKFDGEWYYKIPNRDIYCNSVKDWVREMLWVFIVIKLFRSDIDAITPTVCGNCNQPLSQFPL